MTPLAPGSCELVPLPSALPVQSPGFGVYCSVRNLIYSCQLRLHHSGIRKEVWLFNVHEMQILSLSDFFFPHTVSRVTLSLTTFDGT